MLNIRICVTDEIIFSQLVEANVLKLYSPKEYGLGPN
jgi:hypothetical protein